MLHEHDPSRSELTALQVSTGGADATVNISSSKLGGSSKLERPGGSKHVHHMQQQQQRDRSDVTEATVAAVAAAASAAAAAAAAAVVAAAGRQVQAHLQAHPPKGFPFFGVPPSLLEQVSLQKQCAEVRGKGNEGPLPTSVPATSHPHGFS